MDLNLIAEAEGTKTENINELIQRSYDLGHDCIAINTIINSSALSGKNISIPEPKHITFEGKFGRKFRILNRLTAIIEDPIHAHHLFKSPVMKRYDILALQPVNEKILQHITTLDVEIICLDLTEDLGYTLKSTHVGTALKKNTCFEISYSPCFRSQSSRRSVVSNAQLLVDVCKSKNIIISSGAQKPLELRSPQDIINFSLLFGFKLNQAVTAVKETGNIVISHAGTRRNTGCGFVSITGCLKVPRQQGWIISMCKLPPLSKDSSCNSSKRKLENLDEANTFEKCKKFSK